MNIGNMLKAGRQRQRDEHQKHEMETIGTLRAGNSGIYSKVSGDVAGKCHRVTFLRSLGIASETPSDSKLVMFQMGVANEDVIAKDLVSELPEGYVILREEEFPIHWNTINGKKVTGRPDMIICRKVQISNDVVSNIPVLGVEIKGIASVYTSIEVLFSGPKMDHLIQACHYAWKLGNIPYKLIYKNYVNQVTPKWIEGRIPKENHFAVEKNEKGDVKYIVPFELIYELEITKAGFLRYKIEGDESGEKAWTKTIINTADIENYYEFVSSMESNMDLGPKPINIDAQGKELSYTQCKYCSLSDICRDYSKSGYNKWLEEVRNFVSKSGGMGSLD